MTHSGARRAKLALVAVSIALLSTGEVKAQAAGQWRDANQVYEKICGHCHDTGIGPVIKGRGLPAEYYANTVRHGLKAMPAFRQTDVDDATLAALAAELAAGKATK